MKKPFVIIFFLFLAEASYSCTCMHPSTYCETIQAQNSDLLVLGYKISDIYHGMTIEIVQVLQGSETRDTITVWGDNGMLCRHSTAAFAFQDTIVFALHNCDLGGNMLGGNYEQPDHYQISNCGIYYLDYINGNVFGSIDNGISSLSLSALVQMHASCVSAALEKQSPVKIKTYPNPTNDKINIEISAYNDVFEIKVYGLYGKLLQTTKSPTILLKNYPKGVYVLRVFYGDQTKDLKVVKN